MANLNENLPLTPEEEKKLFKHPMPNKPSSKGCMLSFMLVGVSVFSLFFVACEESRTDRMIKATERAVDDYNNDDSSFVNHANSWCSCVRRIMAFG